jgi:hypothetical protein
MALLLKKMQYLASWSTYIYCYCNGAHSQDRFKSHSCCCNFCSSRKSSKNGQCIMNHILFQTTQDWYGNPQQLKLAFWGENIQVVFEIWNWNDLCRDAEYTEHPLISRSYKQVIYIKHLLKNTGASPSMNLLIMYGRNVDLAMQSYAKSEHRQHICTSSAKAEWDWQVLASSRNTSKTHTS